jgi:hypothetical protein
MTKDLDKGHVYELNGEHFSSQFAYKNALAKSEYNNTYMPWSAEEDGKLWRLHFEERLSNGEISRILRRTLGAIKSRINKIEGGKVNIRADAEDLETRDGENLDETAFLRSILNGYDYNTGEEYSDESIWRHPAIVKTIQEFLYALSRNENDVDNTNNIQPGSAGNAPKDFDNPQYKVISRVGEAEAHRESFFQMEHLPFHTPINPQWGGNLGDVFRIRDENERDGRLLNHGTPITREEIVLVREWYRLGIDIKELEIFFQRGASSLMKLIEE